MTPPSPAERYRNRLLTLIASILVVAGLRSSYPVTMPLLFAAIILASLWPLKLWLDKWLLSALSYSLTVLVLIALLLGFAAAVYVSAGQVVDVIGARWPAIQKMYATVALRAQYWGIPLSSSSDNTHVLNAARTLATNIYEVITYTGFIALLVVLGLPEAARLRAKMRTELRSEARGEVIAALRSISDQVRRYLGTTLTTSVLTGLASAGWALATGLELPLVWGLLNFLLNLVPVIGNIIGIVPPVLYAVVQFGGYGMPLLVFAGFAVLQLAISNFIYPNLQGQQLSLSPLVIVVALTSWTWVWGIAGALIAVPLTAAIVIACQHFERSRWVARLLSA